MKGNTQRQLKIIRRKDRLKFFNRFLYFSLHIYRRYSRIKRVGKRGYAKYTRFQLRVVGVVINSSTSVNGKLRNRWNISILSSRFVQFPPFPERNLRAARHAYTPGQVLLTPVRQRNKNPYGVIGIMLLSPCDGEFRTNCIVRGRITIARGKITSFNSVFRIFLIHSQIFFSYKKKNVYIRIITIMIKYW